MTFRSAEAESKERCLHLKRDMTVEKTKWTAVKIGAVDRAYLHNGRCDMKRLIVAAAAVLASAALNAHAFDKLELEHIITRGTCEKCNFDKADLKNVDFRGVKLDDSHFVGADLRGAKIEDCGECDFTGASLADSDMDRASLDEVVFEKADLTGAKISGTYMHKSNFKGANLTNAQLKRVDAEKSKFQGANLTKASFANAKLRMSQFQGATFKETDFSYADLRSIDLGGLNLEGVIFRGAMLDDASFKGAKLTNADFTGADFGGGQISSQGFYTSDPTKCSELTAAGAIIDATTKCGR